MQMTTDSWGILISDKKHFSMKYVVYNFCLSLSSPLFLSHVISHNSPTPDNKMNVIQNLEQQQKKVDVEM